MKRIYYASAIIVLLISGTSCRSAQRTAGHTYEIVEEQVPVRVEPTIVAPPPPPVIEVSLRQQDEDRDWEREREILQPTIVTTAVTPVFENEPPFFGVPTPIAAAATAADATGLRRFSVVVGSFRLRANADRLQATLRANGHSDVVIARNERGMYRVIVGTFDDRAIAVSQRDQLRRRYSARGNTAFLQRTYGVPFNDLWILDRRF